MRMYSDQLSTPIGTLYIYSSEQGLYALSYIPLQQRAWEIESADLKEVKQELQEYFDGERKHFTIDLDMRQLSPFQNKVLSNLRKVDYGSTIFYKDLAAKSGSPKAARAVGNIMRSNPLPIVIPCHRVLPSSNQLGKYTGGSDKKAWLLKNEGVTLPFADEAVSVSQL